MTDQELYQLVCKISEDVFHKPFLHQAYFNKRLRTTGGRYLLKSHNIEVNPQAYKQYGLKEIEGIIRHELCHYHLHIEGKGYQHRDADFRILLKQANAPRFCSNLRKENNRSSSKKYTYICLKCGTQYVRKIRMNTDKYCCSKCLGRLKLKK
ncbi:MULTISPECIES: SprT family protein [unclassified Rummeliibacillus]|uniref:SprT family protein n=1 Tax=unclassified Rummeliibacillus TaxID=2622809 RepID=UPI000E671F4E|nr:MULTISPECIES: SprT family protein [unclassified Rummeliibacillus]RIJ64351.1 SprT family protein [Rummeliibacillus sp. POC4]RPJ96515.1 SprT family protein [Rummeliibacillus sp. TYF005]